MTKTKSMKRHASRLVVKSKTLTKPACGSQMGGAQLKTAYVMLVPSDDSHKVASKINISDGKTGTIKELISVANLKEFTDDKELEKTKTITKKGTRQVLLGRVGDSVKTIINEKPTDITSEIPIEVKYNDNIELYNPSSTPSTANSDNGTESANLFAQEPAEPEPEPKTPEELVPVRNNDDVLNFDNIKPVIKSPKNNTLYVISMDGNNINLNYKNTPTSSEQINLNIKKTDIITITNNNELQTLYENIKTLNHNCVFVLFKTTQNNETSYYVFNKYSKPIKITDNSVELKSDSCNKVKYLMSPSQTDEITQQYLNGPETDTFKKQKPINQKGGKRITLRKHKKFVAKPAKKTLKRW